MAIPDINLGSNPNDGNGSTLRAGGAIVNQILDMWNFVTGTSGNISFSGGSVGIGGSPALGNAQIEGSSVRVLVLRNTSTSNNSDLGVLRFITDATTRYSSIKGYRVASSVQHGMVFTVMTVADTELESLDLLHDGGIKMYELKSGATQVAAGAAASELWVTSSHATLPDNVVMIGV